LSIVLASGRTPWRLSRSSAPCAGAVRPAALIAETSRPRPAATEWTYPRMSGAPPKGRRRRCWC